MVGPPLDLGGTDFVSIAADVNASGVVAGYFGPTDFDHLEAARWAPDGARSSLAVTSFSFGQGINASGEMVVTTAGAPLRWNPDNSTTPLSTGKYPRILAQDINDAGLGVGYAFTAFFDAVRWDRSGALTALPRGGAEADVVFAISRSGQMVGYTFAPLDPQPVVWAPDGTPTRLPTFAPGLYGEARGLNNAGTIVGEAYDSTLGISTVAVQWKNGVISRLEVPAGAIQTSAADVSDAGIVVGWAWLLFADGLTHAAVWGPDGAYLGDLPPLPGGTGEAAASAIEGNYVAGGSADDRGIARAIRWTLPTNRYLFRGFFPPVRNGGVLNQVKAGSSIPVKFALGGNQGRDILATNSPATRRITCGAGPTINSGTERTVSRSGLHHGAGRYIYVWKTKKAWAGTCREFVLELKDGTRHSARFKFE
jgi:uncharacterized membrane protein